MPRGVAHSLLGKRGRAQSAACSHELYSFLCLVHPGRDFRATSPGLLPVLLSPPCFLAGHVLSAHVPPHVKPVLHHGDWRRRHFFFPPQHGAQCRREMLAPPVCPHSALPWDGQLGGATLALPSHSSAFLLGLSRCGENFVLVGFLLPSGGGEGYFRSQFKVRQLGLASGEAGTVAAHTEGGPLVSLEAKRLGRRWLQ